MPPGASLSPPVLRPGPFLEPGSPWHRQHPRGGDEEVPEEVTAS